MSYYETLCDECGKYHTPDIPHDALSEKYQTWFYQKYGRTPTWEDAMAHCTKDTKKAWRKSMEKVKETTKHLGIET
jgi:hypothetical protein